MGKREHETAKIVEIDLDGCIVCKEHKPELRSALDCAGVMFSETRCHDTGKARPAIVGAWGKETIPPGYGKARFCAAQYATGQDRPFLQSTHCQAKS